MSNQYTLYSILDLALVSKERSYQQTFHDVLKLAQHAEIYGYTRFWLAEHHNAPNIGSNATSVLIGYVAEGTNTLRVGSGGIMLPNHSPLIIAEQFGTLAALYPDRIDLGLGRAPGTDWETMLAIRSDFMNAAYAFPDEIAKIERYFSVNNSSSNVRVPLAEDIHVPMYILGSSTDSTHLAAQKGLPYAFASHFAPAQLTEALRIYHQEFIPSKALKKPYVMAGINVIVADTDEQAERLSTSLIRLVVGIFAGQRDYVQPPTEMTGELREVQQNPQMKQMLKYAFIGSKATVKAQVKDFMEHTQVDELIAVTHLYDVDDRIRSYQLFSEIMQELN